MLRYVLAVLCLLFVLPVCAADRPNPSLDRGKDANVVALVPSEEGSVSLHRFDSVLVVVNENEVPQVKPEEWLCDALKVLKVSVVPEDIAWELYRLSNKNDSVEDYLDYLHTTYDTALQADMVSSDVGYRVVFTFVNFRDPSMPVLYRKELEASGARDVVLKGIFHVLAQDLLVARSNGLSGEVVKTGDVSGLKEK